MVDIESEEEEDNNKEDNIKEGKTKDNNTKEGISDDEEKVPVVKLQKNKTQERKKSEIKLGRNSEIETLRAEVVKLTKDLEEMKDEEADVRRKHEQDRKVLKEKEIEVRNLRAMNEALSKRSEKEKEANWWKAKYDAAMKTVVEKEATIENLETMNETLDKSQGDIIKALKLKLSVKDKEIAEHGNCANILNQERQRAKEDLEKIKQKLVDTEQKFNFLSSEKVPEMMTKFREKLERKEEEVVKLKAEVEVKKEEVLKLKAEVDLQAEVETNLATRIEQAGGVRKDLEQQLAEMRKEMIEKDAMMARARKSQESESKLARLRFQIMDLKDEMMLQKKDQELIFADTEKLVKENVALKTEIKNKDELLQSKTAESGELKDIQSNMMNALRAQKKVMMKAENQEKIIENQKMMLAHLKQQSQAQLGQISRLTTDVFRKSLDTPEASLLKRELRRRTDQLTAMRAELLRVQKSKDSMSKTTAHLEGMVNVEDDKASDVEVVHLEEEVVCTPDIPQLDQNATGNTDAVILNAESVLKTSLTVLNNNETKDLVEDRKCNLCKRVFLDENYLKQHQAKAHMVDLYKKPDSPEPASVIKHTDQTQEGQTSLSEPSHSSTKRTHSAASFDLETTETIGIGHDGGLVKKIRLMRKSESDSMIETTRSIALSILDSLIAAL